MCGYTQIDGPSRATRRMSSVLLRRWGRNRLNPFLLQPLDEQATEAARALVEHAFAVSSLRRLVAAIALGNASSWEPPPAVRCPLARNYRQGLSPAEASCPSMRCSSCSSENREGRKFCAACGAGLTLACSACGANNQPGERFCGECGKQLADAAKESTPRDPRSYTPKHLAEKILTSRSALEGERKQEALTLAEEAIAVCRGRGTRLWEFRALLTRSALSVRSTASRRRERSSPRSPKPPPGSRCRGRKATSRSCISSGPSWPG
jgi:hypothetical protein